MSDGLKGYVDVTVTEESGFSFNYINSPVITGITEGEVMTDRTSSITWQSITGASYYNIFVYHDNVLLLTELDLAAQTTSYTCPQELADGDYIIKLYASTDRWPENDNVVYETITSLSLRSVSFSVQVSGIVDIDVGELLYGYYRVDDTIRRVTLTERVFTVQQDR